MKRESRHVLAVILLVLIGLRNDSQILADTVVWDGSTDMIWSQPDPTSWAGLTFDSGDDAQFLGAGAGIISLIGPITPGSVLVNSSAAYTFTGDGISGTGVTLTKSGTGVLTLLNTNTYTGRTTINGGGILDVGTISNNAISNSSGIVAGTSGSSGVLQGNGTFTRTLSGNSTPGAGQISGQEGGFAARGGDLTVNFGGVGAEIALNTGGWVFGNNFIVGSTSADSKVILQNNLNINSTGGRTITVHSGIGGDSATSTEFSGVVRNASTSAVQIRKNGTGILILSNSANSFNGQVQINAGTVSVASISSIGGGNSSLGAASTVANGTVFIGNAGNTGRLLYTGTGSTNDRVINLAGSTGGAILEQGGTGLLHFTSNFTATVGGNKTLTLQGSTAGTGEISGTIGNPATGTVSLRKDGSGTWTLSGANIYSGDTRINAGTLNITHNRALQNSAFDTSGGGVMTLGVSTPAFGGLKGGTALASAITSGYASVTTLTLNPASGESHSYGGVISNGAADIELIKSGAGNQTLSGINTYSGGTTIENGTLTLDGGSDRLLTSGPVVLGSASTAGKLVLGGTTAANQTLTNLTTTAPGGSVVGGNSTTNSILTLHLTSGSTTFAGTLGGAGTNENRLGLAKSGGGTLLLTATNNTYSGLTSVTDSGVLDVGTIDSGALSATSGLFLGSTSLGSGNFGILQGNGSFTRSLSGNVTPGAGQVAGAAGGFAARGGELTVNFGGAGAQIALNQAGVVFGNNFVFGSSTADSKVVLVNPVNINSGAVNGTRKFTVIAGVGGAEATAAELRGVISNAPGFDNGIRKEGDGMLILSAANNYTGPTLVTAGTVQIGNGGTTGSITSVGAITISAGATFAVNRSDLLTVGNTITGAGEVMQAGSGTTTLTAANTYSGGTRVGDGALVVNNVTGSATGTGAVLVESGATLGGIGSIGGTTTIEAGAYLTGGADIDAGTRGTLSFGGNLDAAGSIWLVDLVESTLMDSDHFVVAGDLNLTDAIFVDRFSGSFTENNTYTIATYTGNLTGTFVGWEDDTDRMFGGGAYRINYNDGGAITLTAVPEPGALLFLLFILVPGWWFFRKRSPVRLTSV